jgi:hypothetical protein
MRRYDSVSWSLMVAIQSDSAQNILATFCNSFRRRKQ